MIQPPSMGPIVPPILNPVVTIPNTRPDAPGGAAARTSMSREGAIMPDRNPAVPQAPRQQDRTRIDCADDPDQPRGAGEPARRHVAMPLRGVGDEAPRQ